MKIYVNYDFQKNQILNAVVQNLTGHPSAPSAGQIDYLSTTTYPYYFNGTSWRPMDAAALTDGSIQLSALATNPLARSNHTGTQTSSTISDLKTTVTGYTLDSFAGPVATVNINNQQLVSLADPTTAQGAATKNYVDNAVQQSAAGIDSKPSVRVVSTSNLTLSGLQTIDGVTLSVGDRVLAVGQTTASQNGVYSVASGVWSRATDADQTGEITPGAFWYVEEGSAFKTSQWRCNNTGVITLGTTAITIVQFGAANVYSAGYGLALTGGTFSVQLASSSGLVSTASGLAIDTTVVSRKAAITITHDGSTTSFSALHNLNTQDVNVSILDASKNAVIVDWTATTNNTVTVNFGSALTTGTAFRVVVIG